MYLLMSIKISMYGFLFPKRIEVVCRFFCSLHSGTSTICNDSAWGYKSTFLRCLNKVLKKIKEIESKYDLTDSISEEKRYCLITFFTPLTQCEIIFTERIASFPFFVKSYLTWNASNFLSMNVTFLPTPSSWFMVNWVSLTSAQWSLSSWFISL